MMLFAILLLNDIRLDLTIGPPIALIPEEAMPLKYARPVPLIGLANASDRHISAPNLTGWSPLELPTCSGIVDCHAADASSAVGANPNPNPNPNPIPNPNPYPDPNLKHNPNPNPNQVGAAGAAAANAVAAGTSRDAAALERAREQLAQAGAAS